MILAETFDKVGFYIYIQRGIDDAHAPIWIGLVKYAETKCDRGHSHFESKTFRDKDIVALMEQILKFKETL